MATDTYWGPIDFAVFALPRSADATPALTQILRLADSGTIEVLDLEVIAKDADGVPQRLPLSVLDHGEDFDFGTFEGAASDILDAEDLEQIAEELDVDEVAVVLVYEDRSLATVAHAFVTEGGHLVWSGGISSEELDVALNADDAQEENR